VVLILIRERSKRESIFRKKLGIATIKIFLPREFAFICIGFYYDFSGLHSINGEVVINLNSLLNFIKN